MMGKIIETIVAGFFVLLALVCCIGAFWLNWKKSQSRKQTRDKEINVIQESKEAEAAPRCDYRCTKR